MTDQGPPPDMGAAAQASAPSEPSFPRDLIAPQAGDDLGLRQAKWIARALDDWYIDPIMGFLLPGLGDFFGAMLGFYIVIIAVQRSVSRVVIARMLINLAIDAVVGAIPIVGDLFDVKFKANRRNVELLLTRSAAAPARPTDFLFILAASTVFSVVALAPVALFFWLLQVLFEHT